jgi:hypothetical protein
VQPQPSLGLLQRASLVRAVVIDEILGGFLEPKAPDLWGYGKAALNVPFAEAEQTPRVAFLAALAALFEPSAIAVVADPPDSPSQLQLAHRVLRRAVILPPTAQHEFAWLETLLPAVDRAVQILAVEPESPTIRNANDRNVSS